MGWIPQNFEPNRWLTDGDQIEIDGEKLMFIIVPVTRQVT